MSANFDVPGEGDLFAILHTTMGDITLRLFEQQVPQTVNNFVGLATGQKEWVDIVAGLIRRALANGREGERLHA